MKSRPKDYYGFYIPPFVPSWDFSLFSQIFKTFFFFKNYIMVVERFLSYPKLSTLLLQHHDQCHKENHTLELLSHIFACFTWLMKPIQGFGVPEVVGFDNPNSKPGDLVSRITD